jgi:hypothetical protein
VESGNARISRLREMVPRPKKDLEESSFLKSGTQVGRPLTTLSQPFPNEKMRKDLVFSIMNFVNSAYVSAKLLV